MRKAVLLYNPLSGSRRERRLADVEAALAVLRAAGVEAEAAPTRSAAEAGPQARQAIAAGCDTVFACGGDGTVHDVLQGLVGSQAALALIPLGTANSLARGLRLPRDPAEAARAALRGQPRRIAVGRVDYQDFAGSRASRYFTVAVGIGVDAHLFYKLNSGLKQHLGMAAYYAKAIHLWLTHKMEFLQAEFVETGSGVRQRAAVSELLAVRIRDFGGVLRELAPGASLERNDLRLVLFRTSSRLAYLRYVLRGLLGRRWSLPGIELRYSERVLCLALPENSDSRIYVEADGELLGTLPAEITVLPDALTVLAPPDFATGADR